jgi:hypothetical protein
MDTAEFSILMSLLSVPRPNGSRALRQTVEKVRAWLKEEDIPVRSHLFTLYPYFMESLGLWLALTGLLLPVAVLGRWGWGGLLLALVTLAVPLLEVRFLRPTVTALLRQPGENLVISFPASGASPQAERHEVILSAHLDSKTELLDHYRRSLLLRVALPAMGLVAASGALIAVGGLLPTGIAVTVVRWLAFLTALPAAAYGLEMGANLVGGRFSRRPSPGAVDNGTSVAILLALARRLHRRELSLERTAITLLLTVGEEAQMQGALAYARDRERWPMPVCVVNLEVMGQNGGYVLWEEDGTAMLRLPTDPALDQALERAVEAATGERPVRVPAVSSDAFAFLRRGIPATTLGSFDLELGGRGFHSALDNLDRVDLDRLAEAVEILSHFLQGVDKSVNPAHPYSYQDKE